MNADDVLIEDHNGLRAILAQLKATTTEGLGYTGRGEGMAAYAVCTIRKAE